MARSVTLLVTGAIAGGALVWVGAALENRNADTGPSEPAPIAVADPFATSTEAPAPPVSDSNFASARLEIFRQAAAATDVYDLEGLIERVSAEPESRLRDMQLEALLARLAELDSAYAVQFAQRLYLHTRFLVPLYEYWARNDADAAIAGLVVVSPAARQRDIALAILGVIGDDEQAFERVAAALPEEDRVSFEIDALIQRAGRNPAAAIRALVAMDNQLMSSLALPRIANAIVDLDPRSAMVQAGLINDDDMRTAYTVSVLGAWAEYDPEGAFAWFETASLTDIPEFSGAYRSLAAHDPERALALVDGLPLALKTMAQSMVMQGIAEGDPEAAIAMLESMPPGQDRERMTQSAASAYARQNPDLALAWVRSLVPPSPSAMAYVVQGIAQVDIDRAIDIVLEELDRGPQGLTAMRSSVSILPLLISMSGSGQPAEFSRVADRLLGVNDPMMRSVLASGIGSWARSDPDGAVAWALENAASLDPSTFSTIGRSLASSDLERALVTLDRLPPVQQGQWLQGVATELARQDTNRAVNLLDRYRGQPGFAGAYVSVAREIARADPEAAAAMLSNAPASNEISGASAMIAMEWSNRDPRAAAGWAQGLADERARTQSINMIASNWTQLDQAAARQWIAGLSRGTVRDAALDGYIAAAAQGGRFDPALIDAYSTEQAQQQGVSMAVIALGRTDPDQAQRLIDTYITDEQLRRQAEEALARASSIGSSVILPNSTFILPGSSF